MNKRQRIKELEEELAVLKAAPIVGEPEPINNPDWDTLTELLTTHIHLMEIGDYHSDSDDKYYVYETALECLFGPGIWEYINSKNT